MMEALSLLIVGCGKIAGRYADPSIGSILTTHAAAFSAHGGFRLVAAIDPSPLARAEFSKRWNPRRSYSSFADLKEEMTNVDVVCICSPTGLHCSDLNEALGLSPRAIFCEKPLSSDLAEAEEMVSACKQSNVPLFVNHTRRWDPSVLDFFEQLRKGLWGNVRSVNGTYCRGLINNGTHMIDLLGFFFNELKLVCVGKALFDGVERDPSIPLILETSRGVPITLSCGNGRDYSIFELSFITEYGVVSMEHGGEQWRRRLPRESKYFQGYRTLSGSGELSRGELTNSLMIAVQEVHSVASGRSSHVSSSGETSLQSLRLCATVLNSLELNFH